MKTKRKLFNFRLFVFIALSSVAASCNKSDPKDKQLPPIEKHELTPIRAGLSPINLDEDELHLNTMIVEPGDAIREITNSKTDLKINGYSVAIGVATISITALDFMADRAGNLGDDACTNPLIGLKISYAIIGNSFKAYYTPVKFCEKSESYGQNSEHYKTYSIIEGDLFEYSGGNDFHPAAGDPLAAISNYTHQTTGIKIKHRPGEYVERFMDGDVRSLIFTFQEINELIFANNGATSLLFWNAIREIGEGSNVEFKHSILLSTNNVGQLPAPKSNLIGAIGFTGRYANLSHMCPPSCNTALFTFRLKH